MWPWSKIKQLERELHKAQIQTLACGMVATGVYAHLTADMFSDSLIKVRALQGKLDAAEKRIADLGGTLP